MVRKIFIILCLAILGWLGVRYWGGSRVPPPAPMPISPPTLTHDAGNVEDVNRMSELFSVEGKKLPIVETVMYESSVPWMKGRPAWIGDYAAHYATSRHFIARSLNHKADYFTQKVSNGQKFNVLRNDKNFQFYLLADLSKCRMAFYYIDMDTQERVLLKVYPIGVGKKSSTPSGSLTPLGKFTLGDRIAVYRPGVMGLFREQSVEMIRVFGTRWIPISGAEGTRGLGIHGAPWSFDAAGNRWVENRSVVGVYESDGCLRMAIEDIEELFAIVITRPTTLEIVASFHEATLPGTETTSPRNPSR